ncbi:uncharacterized protein LOC106160068 isoform X2 [Lingula anatina]|uniref:Uncharacterized protein LOC106160068 isoform X2 n=1 Tax=Lingula anatina TaxID=7574 RepID=A0A1S3I195_LINAN|nr:uncharacterized protein LOC106160068 isoform X2 [Lingula anatina]|eukprot:XP_013392033.1 uncharacterized protein LOC106160068 isoform X2 [Lingula anatina]
MKRNHFEQPEYRNWQFFVLHKPTNVNPPGSRENRPTEVKQPFQRARAVSEDDDKPPPIPTKSEGAFLDVSQGQHYDGVMRYPPMTRSRSSTDNKYHSLERNFFSKKGTTNDAMII